MYITKASTNRFICTPTQHQHRADQGRHNPCWQGPLQYVYCHLHMNYVNICTRTLYMILKNIIDRTLKNLFSFMTMVCMAWHGIIWITLGVVFIQGPECRSKAYVVKGLLFNTKGQGNNLDKREKEDLTGGLIPVPNDGGNQSNKALLGLNPPRHRFWQAGLWIRSILGWIRLRIQQIEILKSDPDPGSYWHLKNQFKNLNFFSHQTYFFWYLKDDYFYLKKWKNSPENV